MSERNREAAIRHWKNPRNRKKLSVTIRHGLKPKHVEPLPDEAEQLQRDLALADVQLCSFLPTPYRGEAYPPEPSWILTALVQSVGDVSFEKWKAWLNGAGFDMVYRDYQKRQTTPPFVIACLVTLKKN